MLEQPLLENISAASDVPPLALASKNPSQANNQAKPKGWLGPGSQEAMAFWLGLMGIFGFDLPKSQARPKPMQFEASQSQSQARKPWLFGLRPKPEHH